QVNSKTVENDDLKAQIQEKVFANVALKNELRKLKGNSVDTKFAKPSILGKPVLQPPRNQSVVRQPTAFKSERPNFSKPRFASQVDVINVLSKPVTPHYLPKVREYVLAKPHHVIAPGLSRNSQEEYYGSNDMAHNHYLKEARKKTQDRNRNSKPSVMPSIRLQNTDNGSTSNPKRTSQTSRSFPTSKSSYVTITVVPKADHSRNSSSFSDSKHFFCSACHKCVFNANHDACITKLLNEVNLRKVKPYKTKNSNNPVEQKSHTQKPGRWIPTGRIFKLAGLTWIPTRKMFIDSTTKVESKPPNGLNEDITNPYECDQTLNVSAGTLNLSAGLVQNIPSPTSAVPPTTNDWDSLFQPIFDEYFKPPPNVDYPVPKVPTPVLATSTSSPSLTTIDQDAPSTSNSQTTSKQQFSVIPNGVEDDFYNIEVAHMDNDPYFGSSEGSGTTPEVPDEPKDNSAVVAEKQAGYVQTNLTLSSAKLEIQSMVDVPIHQEDLAVQRTPLIDPVISMTFQEEFRSAGWCKENSDGQKTVAEDNSEEEEPEDQGRKSQDYPLVSLVRGLVTPSKTTVNALGEEQVEDISPNTLEATKTLSKVASQKPKSIDKGRSIEVSTVSRQVSTDSINNSIPSPDKGRIEGKAPMIIEEAPKKTKEQILQEEVSLAEAIRLDTLEKEKEAKQVHLDSL
ncbi:hypothetical protein Tco_0545902, partial [Tanacetum coccineum]